MGTINKHFWRWNPNVYDLGSFNLRNDVKSLIEKELVLKVDEEKYTGQNEFPWSINATKGKIFSVFFKKGSFFPINNSQVIWDLEYNDFIHEMNNILTPIGDENMDEYKGDMLCVIFRDYYVSLTGVISGKE